MSQEFCPQCGAARLGAFRFCRGCGFDYDQIPPAAATAEPAPEVAPGTLWTKQASARSSGRARTYLVVGAAAILGIGALSNLTGQNGGLADPTAPPAAVAQTTTPRTPSPIPTADTPTSTPAPLGLAPQGDLETATLVRVTDGDTIVVEIDGQEHRLRYIGIDTPEPNHSDPAVRAMAEAASAANAALLDGKVLRLERDTSETDQFDRLLRNVWVEGDAGALIMVGHELVRQGFAQVSTYPPDVRWVDHLLAAQEDARNLAVGLWAPRPTPSPSPAPTPEPTPAPTPLVLVVDDAMRAGTSADDRAAFRGERGYYTFTSVAFPETHATLTWDVRGGDNNCYVEWGLDPEGSGARSDRIGVRAGDRETGKIRFRTPYSTGEMAFKSTCPRWLVSLVGDTPPPPTPRPTRSSSGGGGGGNCHPSYLGECLDPDLSDYDCAGGSGNGPGYVYGTVEVVGYDEYDLDRDNDGLGCE